MTGDVSGEKPSVSSSYPAITVDSCCFILQGDAREPWKTFTLPLLHQRGQGAGVFDSQSLVVGYSGVGRVETVNSLAPPACDSSLVWF